MDPTGASIYFQVNHIFTLPLLKLDKLFILSRNAKRNTRVISVLKYLPHHNVCSCCSKTRPHVFKKCSIWNKSCSLQTGWNPVQSIFSLPKLPKYLPMIIFCQDQNI